VPATEKLYYKIGEIAAMLDVNTSVLRFWETQFSELAPVKTKSGQRLYSASELELLKEIYRLLYQQKLTIKGAQAKLVLFRKKGSPGSPDPVELLQTISDELKELRKLL
jgi:DNA-binding transcriptional MerR regulator